MEHVMKLYENSFQQLKVGNKKREYRLNDEKRKQVRVGDTIKFLKLPDLEESFIVDVVKVETFHDWKSCYETYFEEDFKDRYSDVEAVVLDTYQGGYYTEEESNKYGCVVFTIKKHRVAHLDATVCYLKQDNKVLMIQFSKKWGHVYAPPGGKFEVGESPLDCIQREFYEETGLTLISPKLQGISYWKDETEGIIYIYTADQYEGNLLETTSEGRLAWVDSSSLAEIQQFDQNQKFTPYLFHDELFEGKFLLDDRCKVLDYEIRII